MRGAADGRVVPRGAGSPRRLAEMAAGATARVRLLRDQRLYSRGAPPGRVRLPRDV
ncbi:MAG: hypothetical protein HN867_10370 [Deltaproteobacteria bacterium]|nr:hypothetical protein [Deltaproteobacteria bacterium]